MVALSDYDNFDADDFADGMLSVTVGEDATPGDHTLTVEATMGDDTASATVDVTIAGPADSYGIYTTDADGMATDTMAAGIEAISPIMLRNIDDYERYVLMVRDAAGNVPATPECVTLQMSPDAANEAIAGEGDCHPLDGYGNVSITVTYGFGIPAGTVARLSVKDDAETKAYRYFQFGRAVSTGPTTPANNAPRAVGAISNMYLTVGDAPVTVTAGFADADGDTLGYSASSSDVAVATAMSNGGGSVTVTAVGEGTATITVTASDGQAEATQSFMVTVMEPEAPPVDMTLGSISGLSASSNAAGSATVTWYAAANADVHYVWAAPSDGSDGHVLACPGRRRLFTHVHRT